MALSLGRPAYSFRRSCLDFLLAIVAGDDDAESTADNDQDDSHDDIDGDDICPIEASTKQLYGSKHSAQRPHLLDALNCAPFLFSNQRFRQLRSANSIHTPVIPLLGLRVYSSAADVR